MPCFNTNHLASTHMPPCFNTYATMFQHIYATMFQHICHHVSTRMPPGNNTYATMLQQICYFASTHMPPCFNTRATLSFHLFILMFQYLCHQASTHMPPCFNTCHRAANCISHNLSTHGNIDLIFLGVDNYITWRWLIEINLANNRDKSCVYDWAINVPI